MAKTDKKNSEMPFYLRLCRWAYSSPSRKMVLVIASKFSVAMGVAAYGLLLLFALLDSFFFGLMLIAVSLLPFVLVSLFRRLIDAPRPSELFDFASFGIEVKGKKGRSFPSRHVFSAFLIGTLSCFFAPLMGIAVYLFGTVLAICRVLLGIHFIRDVVAGALVGISTGVIGAAVIILV